MTATADQFRQLADLARVADGRTPAPRRPGPAAALAAAYRRRLYIRLVNGQDTRPRDEPRGGKSR